MPPLVRPRADHKLVQILDTALADAAQRAGPWLVCRPGCTQCCVGVFAINQLDVARLREGLSKLETSDPDRAARVRGRACESLNRIAPDFPGNRETGILDESPRAQRRFEDFANHEPCPALDPETGTCDLYAHRPMTCRTFGPPVRSEQGLGVCELCFQGATDEEVAACEMPVDPDHLEPELLSELERTTGQSGRTIVAFCLAQNL